MKNLFIIILSLIISSESFSQIVFNDECQFATNLGSVVDYCSSPGEFSNVNATLSPDPVPNLCGTPDNDVWFSFTPTAPGALIQLFGGTLQNVNMIIYEGICGSLVDIACTIAGNGITLAEQTIVDLTIGQNYYIRVDGSNVGNFQICIKSFIPVPAPEADCDLGVVLCDKSPFLIENLNGIGEDTQEVGTSCINSERASSWYKWTCLDAGTLTFTLTPNNPNNQEEDLDFAVYELPGGLDDCDNKQILRCMASGETQGQSAALNAPCFGPTGLNETSVDLAEFAGCDLGDDNFVAAIDMVPGVSYALVINNFSMTGFGFSIEFGGTGTFLGPEADFDIEAVQEFECDKSIIFTDLSQSFTDQIVSWNWNFGIDANPSTANDPGPHNIIYESFGPKTAILTVESSRGCLVTKIVDLDIDACCQDTSTLSIDAMGIDPVCFGTNTGEISADGFNGAPEYMFSLDGDNFVPFGAFNNLAAGTYNVIIQDIKGCRDTSVNITLMSPPELVVDAGPDVTVDLGFTTMINATYSPMNIGDSISWCVNGAIISDSNNEGFVESCYNCLDFELMPFGTNTYTIKIIDPAGCRAEDDITVTTNLLKPIYAPNVFSPNGDFSNEIFTLGFGPQVAEFNELLIFDRWGNMVYKGRGLPALRDPGQINVPIGEDPQDYGWDGKINGQIVNPGVFTWMAKVRFIDEKPDGKLEIFTGDVTVVR